MPTAFAAVYLRRHDVEWPVDIGDDPSFAWVHTHGGPVTWGVCRPDLRNALGAEDLVVFIAADRLRDRSPARYAWVGYATVASKVSQTAIFDRPDLAPFRARPNLLIRKSESGVFEHHEPALPRNAWHADWLWRLVHSRRRKKEDFEAVEASNRYDPASSRAAGSLISLGDNYVVFAEGEDRTLVLDTPPLVAEAAKNGAPETWREDALSRELGALLFEGATRMSLRTTNTQTAHPELRLTLEPRELRDRLAALASRHGLTRRKRALAP
jgi:hypothetical protein